MSELFFLPVCRSAADWRNFSCQHMGEACSPPVIAVAHFFLCVIASVFTEQFPLLEKMFFTNMPQLLLLFLACLSQFSCSLCFQVQHTRSHFFSFRLCLITLDLCQDWISKQVPQGFEFAIPWLFQNKCLFQDCTWCSTSCSFKFQMSLLCEFFFRRKNTMSFQLSVQAVPHVSKLAFVFLSEQFCSCQNTKSVIRAISF